MGRVKAIWIDCQNQLEMLEELNSIISIPENVEGISSTLIQNVINSLNNFEKSYRRFFNSGSMDKVLYIRDLMDEQIPSINELISSFDKNRELNGQLLDSLQLELEIANYKLANYYPHSNKVYNSEEYYQKEIDSIKEQKEFLEEELKNQQSKTKQEIQEIQNKLNESQRQIEEYQTELNEKKKSENEIEEWNDKIRKTFSELTQGINPIKNEHKRLKYVFYTYGGLIALSIIGIIILEGYICYKLHQASVFPRWENYFAVIIPIPIIGGLLWLFVSQFNRTQRQLLLLARHIHEIEYIEGLLIAINSLSLNINDSTKRVNQAVEKLLENHLNRTSDNLISDNEILKEDSKDAIPIATVLKLLREGKDIVTDKL